MATPNDPQGNPAIAMVATSNARLPDASKILQAAESASQRKRGILGNLFSRGTGAANSPRWENGNLVFSARDAQLAVALMPAPISWSELEGPCATAWWWPDATKAMRRHTNHFLIALIGGTIEAVERRLMLTQVVSTVASAADSVGVYWGEGTLVHEPRAFTQMAAKARSNNIPGPLWIDVRVEQNDDGTLRCFTTGLAPLGFLEIEVEKSGLSQGDLAGFIGDTACYVVNQRLHIPDGNTMGRTQDEMYVVSHGPSMFDRPTVMRLEMA
jgi:hypothetical protein